MTQLAASGVIAADLARSSAEGTVHLAMARRFAIVFAGRVIPSANAFANPMSLLKSPTLNFGKAVFAGVLAIMPTVQRGSAGCWTGVIST
jgi:hypothetical protein